VTVRVRTLTGSAASLGDHYGRLASGEHRGGATGAVWFGRGAAGLGLVGVPSKGHIRALMGARHSFTGEKLGHAFRKGKVKERPSARGHDMALSVPKDVSVLWALAEPAMCAEIEQAVIASALAVLGRLDQSPPIRTKGELVAGVGIAAAVIPVHMSLQGDPNLHVCGVISSKIQHPDTGRWYALDARELKKHQLTRSRAGSRHHWQAQTNVSVLRSRVELSISTTSTPRNLNASESRCRENRQRSSSRG